MNWQQQSTSVLVGIDNVVYLRTLIVVLHRCQLELPIAHEASLQLPNKVLALNLSLTPSWECKLKA